MVAAVDGGVAAVTGAGVAETLEGGTSAAVKDSLEVEVEVEAHVLKGLAVKTVLEQAVEITAVFREKEAEPTVGEGEEEEAMAAAEETIQRGRFVQKSLLHHQESTTTVTTIYIYNQLNQAHPLFTLLI